MKSSAWAWLALGALALAGCGPGIPDGYAGAWEGIDKQILQAEGTVRNAKRTLESRVARSADNKAIADQLGAAALLKQAESLAAQARKEQQGPLKKAAMSKEQNGPDLFRASARRIEDLTDEAKTLVNRPSRAFEIAQEYGSARAEGRALIDNLLSQAIQSQRQVEVAVQTAKGRHPAKKDDLDTRLDRYSKAMETAKVNRDKLTPEAPLAAYAIALLDAESGALDASRLGGDILSKTSQLDRSYSKTLIDMRAEYEVEVKRSSWNNFSEFDSESEYAYPPVKITAKQFGELAANPGEFSGASAVRLGINPVENMPGGHDSSTFWIEDSEADFSHKYMVTENGRSVEGGWEEVESDFFYNNLENLGMDVLVKEKGMYEEDAMLVPMPPGFAYVNNPRCGKWVNRPEGRAWEWNDRCGSYGSYYGRTYPGAWIMFMDWDDWHKRKRYRSAYYGPRGMFGTYGSAGSAAFAASTWGQTGSLNRQDPGIRGLASGWRGGGPGGGGK